MNNLPGWKMVRTDSGGEVLPGTVQLDSFGSECKIIGVSQAPGDDGPGRITHQPLARELSGATVECPPGVFGLTIVSSNTDQSDDPLKVDTTMPIPDTVEELLDGSHYRVLQTALPSGQLGLVQLIKDAGEFPLNSLYTAMVELAAKAYSFGYAEGKAGFDPAIAMTTHIQHVCDDDGCTSEH